jgi:hypothetical protein
MVANQLSPNGRLYVGRHGEYMAPVHTVDDLQDVCRRMATAFRRSEPKPKSIMQVHAIMLHHRGRWAENLFQVEAKEFLDAEEGEESALAKLLTPQLNALNQCNTDKET